MSQLYSIRLTASGLPERRRGVRKRTLARRLLHQTSHGIASYHFRPHPIETCTCAASRRGGQRYPLNVVMSAGVKAAIRRPIF